ncbi:MAG: tetratricopeptide repeat protein [Deltaproteobacteria bacterium]|nr:tetratricopeptide repeat protein [Deltaproteobacteria bacterium]
MYGRMVPVAAALVVCAACVMAQNGPLSRAQRALEEGDYKEALTHLLAAERYTEPTQDQKAEIIFLRARSYEGLKDSPEAIRLYRHLISTFPDSSYASAAREKLKKLEPDK